MGFAVKQTIKYEAEADPAFAPLIKEKRGCEKLEACIQCGTCSGVCPLSIYMDHTPRQVILLTRSGFRDEVLKSNTIWLCASCYECTVACPKDIKITDIIYSLKQEAIKARAYPRGLPIPVLAKEFYKMVRTFGRTTESFLVLKLFLKTNLLALFKMSGLGIQMLGSGRFSFMPEKIRQRRQLSDILDRVEGGNGDGNNKRGARA
jgi:heterodisulfide reductase subunit C